MSRSDYSDDGDFDWHAIMYRGAVASAFRGKRGQAFLQEMLVALDAMPDKRLIDEDLERNGEVCAIGAVGRARGIDMSEIHDSIGVAVEFCIAHAMAREIMFMNDDAVSYYRSETPEQRFTRMRTWIASKISESWTR